SILYWIHGEEEEGSREIGDETCVENPRRRQSCSPTEQEGRRPQARSPLRESVAPPECCASCPPAQEQPGHDPRALVVDQEERRVGAQHAATPLRYIGAASPSRRRRESQDGIRRQDRAVLRPVPPA